MDESAKKTGPKAKRRLSGLKKSTKATLKYIAKNWYLIVKGLFVIALIILVLGLVTYLSFLKDGGGKGIDKNEFQAVVVQTSNSSNQLYFGHITTLNSHYYVLQDVYYFNNVNQVQTTESNSITNANLVKLGCEAQQPEDKITINTSDVIFWENMKSSSKVTQSIIQYQAKYPNGQSCS